MSALTDRLGTFDRMISLSLSHRQPSCLPVCLRLPRRSEPSVFSLPDRIITQEVYLTGECVVVSRRLLLFDRTHHLSLSL